MIDPERIVLSIFCLWLIVAALVVGYPLVTGRIRAASGTFSRGDDPRAFWKAYFISTILFLGASIAAGFFVHTVLQLKH